MTSRFPIIGAKDVQTFAPALQSFFLALARQSRWLDTIASVEDITTTLPSVTSANAATQGGSYVQADVQSIATLANELKSDLTAALAVMAEIITALNAISAALRNTPVQRG